MPFQKTINNTQAPGVAGDFASTNPFSSITAAPGALVAPAGGLTVGNFFWVGPLGQTSQSFVNGWQIAFLGRNEQALIVEFLGESTLVVPEGFMVTGFNGGDFWANFANGATAGAGVFADEDTGAPQMQATNVGTGQIGFVGTGSLVALSNVLTVVTTTSGVLNVGDAITATGTSGLTVASFGTYTPASGVGTVNMSGPATTTEATEAVTTSSNFINITAIATGGFSVGDPITGGGSGIPAGTVISALGTGTGGVGTYQFTVNGLSTQETAASQTVTGPANTSTGWTVGPITLVGAGVAKISHSAV
jgi:hypothetical protein